MSRVIRRLREEGGITLVELLVSMSIMSIVLLVFTTTLTSVQRAIVKQDTREQQADQARLALQTIDRQVRSGNLLYNPTTYEVGNDPYSNTATGYLVRIYTQAKFNADDNPRCVVWLIDDQRRLLTRSWTPPGVSAPTDWQIVATGVVNRFLSSPSFTTDSTGRTLNVTFKVNPSYSTVAAALTDAAATQTFEAALTGRNTSFGYPNDVCEDLPSGMLPTI